MYLEFFNLREYPFGMGCDERFFYESSIHAEALANVMYTFQQRKGMVMISGEVGAGKTFIGHLLLSRLGASCQAAILKNPAASGKQLLRALATGLGIRTEEEGDKLEMVVELQDYLVRMFRRDRLVAVIIDECQDLTAKSLEEIRLLWNWEQDGQRLLQIVLIGQPELRVRLLEPRWESLRQRIVLSYHLGHLTAADTENYVRHRLRVAAAEPGCRVEFLPQAMNEIYAATNGIPRLINVLCDNALLVGYARSQWNIDRQIVQDVLRDMTCWGLQSSVGPVAASGTKGSGA